MNNNNQTDHEENMKDPAERLTYALFGVKVAMLAVHESVHALGYDFEMAATEDMWQIYHHVDLLKELLDTLPEPEPTAVELPQPAEAVA